MSSEFVFPKNQPVVQLSCEKAFEALTDKEKLYAHYLSRAGWYGGLIVLFQTSCESPLIFLCLHKLFKCQTFSELKDIAINKCDFSEDQFTALLIYTSGIFTNMGNYKGLGDTKFIPDLPEKKMCEFIMKSDAYLKDKSPVRLLLPSCLKLMFSLKSNEKQLGLKGKGVTTYFSSNCSLDDANFINTFMIHMEIGIENTRAFKYVNKNGIVSYEVRLASVFQTEYIYHKNVVGVYKFKDHQFVVTRGDYSALLSHVVDNLDKAKKYAANDKEVKMIDCYVQSFTSGSLHAHIDGSRHWIKNVGPIVETYMGFIESYRDPVGMRGEFECFVGIVNKSMSLKFGNLVAKSEEIIPLLPWPAEYERDVFLRPDFTSLDLLTAAGSGLCSGINIPNYDQIRQNEGFKNVSLGNVINAQLKNEEMPFVSAEDQVLLNKHNVDSFEVQVGLHELFGHGSGKLFTRLEDFNFDIDKVKHLETGEKIGSWYEIGEGYNLKFASLASAYEECRSECVGLYLCLSPIVWKVFEVNEQEVEDIYYSNWLWMLWKGLMALEMYRVDSKSWLQAHAQARYVILNVLLEAGEGFVKIEEVTDESGTPNLLLSLDRSKINTVGKEAVANFLRKLQVYKSCGDVANATALFDKYSKVSDDDGDIPFLSYRKHVMEKKQPRKMFVQANTIVEDDGKVTLRNYEATHEGLIQSWIDRFESSDIDKILFDLWSKDKANFL